MTLTFTQHSDPVSNGTDAPWYLCDQNGLEISYDYDRGHWISRGDYGAQPCLSADELQQVVDFMRSLPWVPNLV